MTQHPLLQAALTRMAEHPDGQDSGFSVDCMALTCGWTRGIASDYVRVHTVLEDHALETVTSSSTRW